MSRQKCHRAIINGEAIVTNDKGLAVVDLIREHRGHAAAELCAKRR